MMRLFRDDSSTAICVAIALYHLLVIAQVPSYLGYFIPLQIHASFSLAGALIATFLLRGDEPSTSIQYWSSRVLELCLLGAGLVSLGFIVFRFDTILNYAMFGSLDGIGMAMALLLIAPLMVGVWRKTGIVLPIIILSMIGIVLFQDSLPGILYGRGYPLERLLFSAYAGSSGIFGIPLRVAADIIIVYILLGALIQASGAGAWFLDLALALTGKVRGGPAKAAVVASAFFGSVSGSPSANAATTGVFTIPLMIRTGYPSRFAAAVEAVASTGGQILPPVMGAIAFVMADWTGRSYAEVVRAALIPALLYFAILYCSVHFRAGRDGLTALKKEDVSRIGPSLKKGWFYLVPVLALIAFLFVVHLPPGMAGVLSMPFVIGVSFLSSERRNRLTPPAIAAAIVSAIHNWKGIALITASVGIMVGAMELSGVGIKLSDFIIDLSNGDLILTMILIGFASLILGMGLDSIPAYITLATLLAPALIALGVPDIAAHLFVVYWGLASFFTPPLCIAVFVTTSISGSAIWETGWESLKLGLGAFLIPFAFVLEPSLLLMGSPTDIALNTLTAFLGAVGVAAGLQGFFRHPLAMWQRTLLLMGGCAMIFPDWSVSVAGFGVALLALLVPRMKLSG